MTIFNNWGYYANLIRESKFDIVEANNDYSAADLLENLRLTFNPGRPLVLLPQSSVIPLKLERANSEKVPSSRFAIFEDIGTTLLDEALIIPLYHQSTFVYLRNTYSPKA